MTPSKKKSGIVEEIPQKKETTGLISAINGSIITVKELQNPAIGDKVIISDEYKIVGEIIKIIKNNAIIQCFEDTIGLKLYDKVTNLHRPVTMQLGPGMIKNIYDGVQRPLEYIAQSTGDYILRGIDIPALDEKKRWQFKPTVRKGDSVDEGDIVGEIEEFTLTHKIMLPIGFHGKIEDISEGMKTIKDPIYSLRDNHDHIYTFPLYQEWPIRRPRPYGKRKISNIPLITGTRVFDLLFPVAQGGTVAIPGGFGTGKTVVQQSLSKFAKADVIIYIGCGERGNEIADLLDSFPHLEDPYSHHPLMERTIMIANTSNMPVSAREASIFSGITIAEYWRDMGYNVLVLADSTSRWAEALREISARLEEMPTEGGYPSYLADRLGNFYERAGSVETLGYPYRDGAITVIGAVSPQGGDFSEPVTTQSKRFIKSFWALDARLAYARHYPSVNWTDSYSLYDNLADYWETHIFPEWQEIRQAIDYILARAGELESIAKLIGDENLPPQQQLILYTADLIKNGFLIQNQYSVNDSFSSPMKTMRIAKLILKFYNESSLYIQSGVPFFRFKEMESISQLRRARLDFSSEDEVAFDTLDLNISGEFLDLERRYLEII